MKKKIGVVGDREMLFSELRYRRLFETAQDGILLVDFETGMILDVNQFLIDLLGYSKNDFLGKHLWDVGALKDIAASKDNYYTLQKKRYVRFENLPLKTKTGKEVDVEFVSNAYRAGKEMIIQCNIRDITDRKKVQYLAQEDLRASEETLSSTLFATNIGSYRTDFVKGVWTSSEVLDGIFGIKKNYKRSIQNWLALVYPEDREMMKKYLEEEIFTNHKSFNKEYRIRRKTDGEMRWVLGLGKVDCDSNGRAIFMVGTIKDITDRKNAEEKLKISQERYSAIFDQSLIAIEFYDADGNLVSVNNVCLELFGVVDSAEVKGFKLFDDPNISKDIKDRLLNNETVRFDAEFSFEEVKKRRLYRTTCSGVKILNWLMTPLRSAGVTIGYILQIRDITVQKRAEEAIQREQLLTKAIIDSIPGAFYVLDEKGCYVRWNAYQRDEIVGKPEDQVLGTSAAGTIHPDDRALIQEKIVNVLVNGVDEIVEGRVLLRGGPEYRWLLMTGRRMILDGKPFLVGIGVDITENVNAERFIYEVKMRNEAILDSIGDAVFATDIDGKIILINKMAEEMICVNADKAIGNHYDKVIHFVRENDGKPSNDFIAAAIKDNKITSMANHTLLVRNDGSKISVADSAAPVKDIKGDISGCVVVFRDVTKDRQIDKAKNEFVSLTSHQLRTPTTAISWYSEALLADDASVLNTKQKKYLTIIRESNQRMVDLMNELLDISKIELGTFEIRKEPVDLSEIADSVLQELDSQIIAKKLVVEKKYKRKDFIIQNDSKLLRVIFQNLLTNAVDYTSNHGKISMGMKKDSAGVTVSIRDTGCGIPADVTDKIYSKFFRADNARLIKSDGTGLGLYITKSIVNSIGGDIHFESKEGEGTEFVVNIGKKKYNHRTI